MGDSFDSVMPDYAAFAGTRQYAGSTALALPNPATAGTGAQPTSVSLSLPWQNDAFRKSAPKAVEMADASGRTSRVAVLLPMSEGAVGQLRGGALVAAQHGNGAPEFSYVPAKSLAAWQARGYSLDRLPFLFGPGLDGLSPEAASEALARNSLLLSGGRGARFMMLGTAAGGNFIGLGAGHLVGRNVFGFDPVRDANANLFVSLYTMEGVGIVTNPAAEVMANRLLGMHRLTGSPWNVTSSALVESEGEQCLKSGYEGYASFRAAYGASFTRSLGAAMGEGVLAARIFNLAKRPVVGFLNSGPGMLGAILYNATLGRLIAEDPRQPRWERYLRGGANVAGSLLTFMGVQSLAGGKGLAALGLKALGRVVMSASIVDIAARAIQWGEAALTGRNVEYDRSVNERVFQLEMADSEKAADKKIYQQPVYMFWDGGGDALGNYLIMGGHALMPVWAGVVANDHFVTPTSATYERQVLLQDAKTAALIREALPDKMRAVLAHGIEDASLQPEFYRSVDLSALQDTIGFSPLAAEIAIWQAEQEESPAWQQKPPDQRREALRAKLGQYPKEDAQTALTIIDARIVHNQLKELHLTPVEANDPWRAVVDDDGHLQEGQEDAFLALAYPGKTPAEAREAILENRKALFVERIMGAEGEGREKLMAVAREAGLVGSDGKLARTPAYMLGMRMWSLEEKSTSPDRVSARVSKRIEEVRAEFAHAKPAERPLIERELAALLAPEGASQNWTKVDVAYAVLASGTGDRAEALARGRRAGVVDDGGRLETGPEFYDALASWVIIQHEGPQGVPSPALVRRIAAVEKLRASTSDPVQQRFVDVELSILKSSPEELRRRPNPAGAAPADAPAQPAKDNGPSAGAVTGTPVSGALPGNGVTGSPGVVLPGRPELPKAFESPASRSMLPVLPKR